MTERCLGLQGETIVCLAPDPWAGLWRNRHQIMTRLARCNLVLYVEPRVYLWEALRQLLRGRLSWKAFRAPLATHVSDGLWVYHDPRYAPFAGRLSGGPLTAGVRRRALWRTIQALRGDRPILWLLRPYQADQIGQIPEKLVVYHVTDEYSAYPSVTDCERFRRDEQALLARADLVIVTSHALLESKRRHNPHTYLVPNAVDARLFADRMADPPPPELGTGVDGIPHPRLGYAGALNEKVDFDLLAALARNHPEWHLVLIGTIDLASEPSKAEPLNGLSNVHWLGRLPLEQLPAAIASLDVCLLPYERNEWTLNIDSLKLYEYLACGVPIVSTDLPAARAFGDAVRLASSAEEFDAGVSAALNEDDPRARLHRQELARDNSWEHRVACIERLLAEALERSAPGRSATMTTKREGGR